MKNIYKNETDRIKDSLKTIKHKDYVRPNSRQSRYLKLRETHQI